MLSKIYNRIDDITNTFADELPKVQNSFYRQVQLLLKELDLKDGSVAQSAKNYRILNEIRGEIEKLIRDKQFSKQVGKFIDGFNEVVDLQNEYFKSINSQYSPTDVSKALINEARGQTFRNLKLAGNTIAQGTSKLIADAISAGSNWTDLLGDIREYITTTETPGAFERYAKQIATDAINQTAGQYTALVTADLGLEWYIYEGILMESSRCFCEALVKKKYYHKSELADIIRGDFKEFKDLTCGLNDKTDLPQGMIAGTTPENFSIYRGGYNCNHQASPVSVAVVPVERVFEIYQKDKTLLGKASINKLKKAGKI